jgi:hypothetical protein
MIDHPWQPLAAEKAYHCFGRVSEAARAPPYAREIPDA